MITRSKAKAQASRPLQAITASRECPPPVKTLRSADKIKKPAQTSRRLRAVPVSGDRPTPTTTLRAADKGKKPAPTSRPLRAIPASGDRPTPIKTLCSADKVKKPAQATRRVTQMKAPASQTAPSARPSAKKVVEATQSRPSHTPEDRRVWKWLTSPQNSPPYMVETEAQRRVGAPMFTISQDLRQTRDSRPEPSETESSETESSETESSETDASETTSLAARRRERNLIILAVGMVALDYLTDDVVDISIAEQAAWAQLKTEFEDYSQHHPRE